MSTQVDDSPFQDEHTNSRGNAYFITVEPVFDELITEAVTLIARSRPENVRQSYISQFSAAAKSAAPIVEPSEEQEEEDEEASGSKKAPEDSPEVTDAKRKVFKDLLSSLKQLRLEGSDKEFEGFSNLILSLLLSLFPSTHPDFSTLILMLVDSLSFSQDRTVNPSLSTRYNSISTIFNSLPISSSSQDTLRLNVLLRLITYAAANDDFSIVQPALDGLESYLVQWGFGPGSKGEEEGNKAIATVVKALVSKDKKADARSLLLSHLSSASASSESAKSLSSELIVLSLSLPSILDFSSLSTLSPSISALKDLLTIFLAGDLSAFSTFVSSHGSVLKEQGLEKEQLERKLKLLALAELCSKKVGESVSYEEIAKTLKLDTAKDDDGEEVETWVIDAIRASLISGRLSQPLLSFHVTRAAPRAFTPDHWKQLHSRLQGWRGSLDSIIDSVGKGVSEGQGHGVGAAEIVQRKEE